MTLTQVTKAGLHEIALDHVFTIGASGQNHYTFQGEGLNGTVNDPTLYLTRGKTYRFENGTGAHPLRIQSTAGSSGTAYNTGVTGNNTTGTVIIEVQHDAPDVLYYQCTQHPAMNGILYITGALADGAVTETKIGSVAVTTAKLAPDAVTDTVLSDHASDNSLRAVNTNHIKDDAVTAAKIADDAVTSDQIASNSVTNDSINNNSIHGDKLTTATISLAKFANGTSSNDGKFLRANNGSAPTFETVDFTTLNASNLTSGTIPDARFPATLPAISGANLTGIATATTAINSQSSAYTLVASDAGKVVYISTGGITVPNSVFSAGEEVTLINNSGNQQLITQGSGVTIYNYDLINSLVITGSCSLPPRGYATLFFATASTVYIRGADPVPTVYATNSTNVVLSTAFGSDWSKDVPKIYNIPSGVTIGGTGDNALIVSTGMSNTLVINVSGTIMGRYASSGGNGGAGGSASSTQWQRNGYDGSGGQAGGHAINVQSANVTINNLSGGQISGGGGKGGGGGGGEGGKSAGLGWVVGGTGGNGGNGAGYGGGSTGSGGSSGSSANNWGGDGGTGGAGGDLGQAGSNGSNGGDADHPTYAAGNTASPGDGGAGGAAGNAIYSSNSSSWTNGTTSGTYHGSYT